MRNVKIVRMITGEDVICDFVEDEGGTYMVEPLEISMKKHKGNATVVLANWLPDRKSTRLNSSHSQQSRMPSSA